MQLLHCLPIFLLHIRHKTAQWTTAEGGDLDARVKGMTVSTSTTWTATYLLTAEIEASKALLDGKEAALPDCQ